MITEQSVHTAPSPWYLVKLRADEAMSRDRLLAHLGLESLHPVRIEYRHRSKVARAKREPKEPRVKSLLGGYLWVRGPSISDFWAMMWKLQLIDRVDGLEGWPRAWPDEVVLDIKRRYPMSEYTAPDTERFMQTYHEFREGEEVNVDHPAMAGWAGKVVSIRDEVTDVEGEILGVLRKVEVPTALLRKAG